MNNESDTESQNFAAEATEFGDRGPYFTVEELYNT